MTRYLLYFAQFFRWIEGERWLISKCPYRRASVGCGWREIGWTRVPLVRRDGRRCQCTAWRPVRRSRTGLDSRSLKLSCPDLGVCCTDSIILQLSVLSADLEISTFLCSVKSITVPTASMRNLLEYTMVCGCLVYLQFPIASSLTMCLKVGCKPYSPLSYTWSRFSTFSTHNSMPTQLKGLDKI